MSVNAADKREHFNAERNPRVEDTACREGPGGWSHHDFLLCTTHAKAQLAVKEGELSDCMLSICACNGTYRTRIH